jgi:5-methylcytosine-specific restriction endonuclease McrA
LIPDVATFAPHEIDHIIAKKHGGRTEAENLALSCTLCNKYKGSDPASVDPETG